MSIMCLESGILMKRIAAILTLIAVLSLNVPSARSQAVVTPENLLQGELNELLITGKGNDAARLDEMRQEMRSRARMLFGRSISDDDLTVTPATSGSFARVALNSRKANRAAFIESLRASGYAVEHNQRVDALMLPNDTFYAPHQWNLKLIGMEKAWDNAQGEGVTVALIDSGIAYENSGSFRKAPDFTDTAFVEGYDFVGRDSRPNDENGHGTHIASILAASTNNGQGIAGVAPRVALMPVKILNRFGQGTLADLAEAIRWAADHGAQVINLSVGVSDSSEILNQALAYAYGKGAVLVAAAGNSGSGGLMYPAAVHEYVIAVGAVDARGQRAPYSSIGELDVLAPGGDLDADVNGDGYGDGVLGQTFTYLGRYPNTRSFTYTFAQGTSVASPHVSGVAAMLVSLGITDPVEIRDLLRKSATDLGTQGWDTLHGAGLLDAARALALAKNPVPVSAQSSSSSSPENPDQTLPQAPSTPAAQQNQQAPQNAETPPAQSAQPDQSGAPAEDSAPPQETAPSAPAPKQLSLHVELSFLNIFGRAVTSFVWWEAPRVLVKVTDQDGKPVEGADVEIRYRYQGEQKDLGSKNGATPANGIVEFILQTFARKKTIEAGVVANKNGVYSALQMGSFSIR